MKYFFFKIVGSAKDAHGLKHNTKVHKMVKELRQRQKGGTETLQLFNDLEWFGKIKTVGLGSNIIRLIKIIIRT